MEVGCEGVWEAADKCEYARTPACDGLRSGIIDYAELAFCTSVLPYWMTATGLGLWMITLFLFIGIASSDFFCPNLRVISIALRLSETLAGVTILAFGNGSPDLFSTFSAFKANAGSLAVGELVGAAMFITTMVIGAVAIYAPYKVRKKPFFRDLIFFAGALALLLFVLHDKRIHWWEGLILVVYYVSYVLVVVYHNSGGKGENAGETVSRPQESTLRNTESQSLLPAASTLTLPTPNTSLFSSTVMDTDIDEEDQEYSQQLVTRLAQEVATVYAEMPQQRLPLISVMELNNAVSNAKSMINSRRSSVSVSESERQETSVNAQPIIPQVGPVQLYNVDHEGDTAATLQIPSVILPGDSASNPSSSLPRTPTRQSTWIESQLLPGVLPDSLVPDIIYYLFPLLHPHDFLRQTPFKKATSLLVTPLWLLLRMTTPVATLQRAKSDFDPLATGSSIELPDESRFLGLLDPAEVEKVVWELVNRHTTQAPSIAGDTTSILAPNLSSAEDASYISKSSKSSSSPHWKTQILMEVMQIMTGTLLVLLAFDGMLGIESELGFGLRVLLGLTLGGMLITVYAVLHLRNYSASIVDVRTRHRAPRLQSLVVDSPSSLRYTESERCLSRPFSPRFLRRKNLTLSVVGMVIALVWIANIANEVVGALQTFGLILSIPHSMLGITIFAMGNSLADFIANVTMAKLGYPLMAVSACYGSPMLNMMLGIGLSSLYMNITTDGMHSYPLPLPTPIIIGNVGLLIIFLIAMIYVPKQRYKISKPYGIFLVSMYAILITTIILAQIFIFGV